MHVITERDHILAHLAAAPAWHQPSTELGAALRAVDPDTVTVETLDGIYARHGRKGSVGLTCDECQQPARALVHLGDPPDFDSRWVDVCSACLARALDLIPG